jgi:hypothetical protein
MHQTATNSKAMIYWPSPMLDFAQKKTEPAMSSIHNTTVDRAVAVACEQAKGTRLCSTPC